MINNIKVSNEFINLPAKLEARGYDMILFVAHKLQSEQITDLNVVSFTRKEIIETLKLNKTIGYRAIDKVISNMMNNKIDYSTEDNSFISFLFAEYNRDIEEMSIRVTERMAKFFLHLSEQYTIADLHIITQLKSIFSKRIYMMILQYRNLKNNRVIEVDSFKKILQVEGKYKTKQHLCTYILDVAEKEINKILPQIKFKYSIEKDNNKKLYIHFTFDFSFIKELPQPQQEPQQEQEEETSNNQDSKEIEQQERQIIKPEIKPSQYVKPVENKDQYFKSYQEKAEEYKKNVLEKLTADYIYGWCAGKGIIINAEKFLAHYSSYGWVGSNNRYIMSWQDLVMSWAISQEKIEGAKEDALKAYQKWESEYASRELYNKLKEAGIDNKDFAAEMHSKNLEYLFNYEEKRFYTEEELDREYSYPEKCFYNRWGYMLDLI